MLLTDHPDWKQPHSIEWYDQIGRGSNRYSYNWSSTYSGTTGEELFDERALKVGKGKSVLDIGCAEGTYTKKWSQVSEEAVGLDASASFIESAKLMESNNLSFIHAHSKNRFPLKAQSFQVAYIRKGPTSGYSLLPEALVKGGLFLGLHPGDRSGDEFQVYFPALFEKKRENEVLKKLEVIRHELRFTTFEIEETKCIEWIQSPADVIKVACFGQKQTVLADVLLDQLANVSVTFNQHASSKGLPVTYSRYLIHGVL